MLFDAHTHLNFEDYTDEERKELASAIEASEVGFVVDAGDSVSSSEQAVADADTYDWCYAAVGIHPAHASVYTDADIDKIRNLAAHPKAAAVGEIGLDFYYGRDDQREQQELFRKQIRLANELRLPIMIHSRDAHQLTMDILKEEGAFSRERISWFEGRPAAGGLSDGAYRDDFDVPGLYTDIDGRMMVPDARVQLHCFSGSPELAAEYVKLGATISLGGPITFKNGKRAAETARSIPLEFLLSETDAPYLAPEPLRGRPNRSPYIEHVVRRMAMLKGIGYEETADVLLQNGKRFFGIKDRPPEKRK